MRWLSPQRRARLTGCEFAPARAARSNMHGVRRDALCVVLPSDTMRVATRPFSYRHDGRRRRRAPLTGCDFARERSRESQTCIASDETRFAWRRCVATMRMATRPFSTRQEAMVIRWPSPQRRATPFSRARHCTRTRPNMHGVRRDALCVAAMSDTTRMRTRQFCDGQEAM